MKDKKKKSKKFVFGIFIGLLFGNIAIVGAYSIYANNVIYDNTNSGLTSTDANGAIDELYYKVNNQWCKKGYSKESDTETETGGYICELPNLPQVPHYAYGNPTTVSTTDYTTLNKNVFVAKNGDQKSVCIIRNSRLHCFDNNNWAIEKDHVQQVFSDISCDVFSSSVLCDASDFTCRVSSDGRVQCYDQSDYSSCYVTADGSVNCN